jgi:hypothetical protein
MTSTLPETKATSRRALLAGALGGLGALAASAIGRATPVRGSEGQAVVVGGDYAADTATGFNTITSTGGDALYGVSDFAIGVRGAAVGTLGTGVLGHSGVAVPAPKARTGVYGYANQNSSSHGVWGDSPLGQGIVGSSTSGYAGYFIGRVYTTSFYELTEAAVPAAPLANGARLFVKDNGEGKTQLCVRFATGAVQILATQP